MDPTDLVVMVLGVAAFVGLTWMMAAPRDLEKDPDQRALRAWARADRDSRVGEPQLLTQDRLMAWRKGRAAKQA